jgi:HAD superfamily hydrolase (TIGR01509 family)
MNPRALLIDLDGVIRRWPVEDNSFETTFGIPAGSIREIAFDSPLLEQAITGQISHEQWRQAITTILANRFPQVHAQDAVAAWSETCGVVDQPTLDVIRWSRSFAKVVLVTNATSRLNSDLNRLGLLSEFDAIINSAQVGFAKPLSSIYAAALKAAGVAAEAALFVDDQRKNVEAATKFGMLGHEFKDAALLQAEIQSLWGASAA